MNEVNTVSYHQFIFHIRNTREKASALLSEQQFEQMMNLLKWKMPYNVYAYHCEKSVHAMCNPVLIKYPEASISLKTLLQGIPTKYIRLKDKRRQITLPVRFKAGDYILADTEDGCGRLYYADGELCSLITQMTAIPITFEQAREYVQKHHRHCAPPRFHKFSICLEVTDESEPVGVAIASIPKARYQMDGKTLEINRCCATPCYADVCSNLLARIIRIGREMGYTRFLTYTLESESGSSLRAVGFRQDGFLNSSSECWDSPSRRRDVTSYPEGKKIRWVLRIDK